MKNVQCALLSALLLGGASAETPVDKVIAMLKDMTANLESEAKKDKELDEKMQTWCSDQSKEKKRAILQATGSTIPNLNAEISRAKLEQARLGTEIKTTTENQEKATKSLDSATMQRENGQKAFDEASTFMQETIDSLEKAKKILRVSSDRIQEFTKKYEFMSTKQKVNAETESSVSQAMEIIREVQRKNADKFMRVLSDEQRDLIMLQGAASQPSTDMILGIVEEMDTTFKRDLKDAKDTEAKDIKTFAELKDAKETEIQACKDNILSKETQKATAAEEEASSTRDHKQEKADLALNQKYAEDIRVRCEDHDDQYKERSRTRTEEIATVSKATKILSDPRSLENFDKTFTKEEAPAAFFQISQSEARKVQVAAHALEAIAKDSGSPAVAALALSSSKASSLARVKKAIEKMIEELQRKKKSEDEQNTLCLENTAKNKADTEQFTNEKAETEALATSIQETIATIDKLVAKTNDEIATLEKELADATATRKEENTAFNAAVTEQQKTQELLKQAIYTMRRTYKEDKAALIQVHTRKVKQPEEAAAKEGPKAPEGDEAFEDYKMTESGGVMGLLDTILADTEALEADSKKAEKSAEDAFRAFKQETDETVMSKKRLIINKNSDKSKEQKQLLLAKDDIKAQTETLANLAEGLKAIKKECDFLVDNFDKRQNGYTKEIEALGQAKNILGDFKDFKRRELGF
eukprot:TRINITY_DN93720_c0_g1_i1.p1 TRINITY_DN93720_c0_g1~~TRINITY_DN93720_c0_g1_i1.p1  ORF type:complete len:699 (-),score=255.07 TRINITY_DN93720_c0_g1_i1:75-2171(-)